MKAMSVPIQCKIKTPFVSNRLPKGLKATFKHWPDYSKYVDPLDARISNKACSIDARSKYTLAPDKGAIDKKNARSQC